MNNGVWLVVVSQGGKALGVFGSALSREAQLCAARVQLDTGFTAWVVTVRGARPSVGDAMPADGSSPRPAEPS